LIAGIIALLFTWALLKLSVTMAAEAIPAEYGSLVLHVTPDPEIFVYVLAISLIAGVLFGLAPALERSRSALSSAVNASTASSPMRRRRLRDILIAAQVAISLVLLIAGSMLIRSSIHALRMDTGYDTKHVVDFDLQFPEGPKYTADRRNALVRELRNRLAGLPEVAAITSARPPDGGGIRMSHSASGVDARSDAEGHVARIRLGRIGASALEQLLQPFMPRSGEFRETQPGESSCATQ
jgi:cell division protein FtsX